MSLNWGVQYCLPVIVFCHTESESVGQRKNSRSCLETIGLTAGVDRIINIFGEMRIRQDSNSHENSVTLNSKSTPREQINGVGNLESEQEEVLLFRFTNVSWLHYLLFITRYLYHMILQLIRIKDEE